MSYDDDARKNDDVCATTGFLFACSCVHCLIRVSGREILQLMLKGSALSQNRLKLLNASG